MIRSFNHFSGDWSAWLVKFEALLHKLYWYEAYLHLDMEHYGSHQYNWKATYGQIQRFHLPEPLPVSEWEFSGGPRSFSA